MKKIILLSFSLLFAISFSKAQTTAIDFNMSDCATGNMHHLFSTLDSNDVVIMEFFMTCTSCIDAGHKIEAMLPHMYNQYPEKIKWYQFGYTNSYNCNTVNDFVTTNGFTCVPFDSGQAMVAYYGGFGMPTIAVVAGTNHEVLFTDVGFVTSDTTAISNAIHNFYSALAGVNSVSEINSFNVFPNPASDLLTIQLNLKSNAIVQLQLFDLSGKLTTEIFNGQADEGMLNKKLSVTDYTEGIYLLKATVNGKTTFNKVNIVK